MTGLCQTNAGRGQPGSPLPCHIAIRAHTYLKMAQLMLLRIPVGSAHEEREPSSPTLKQTHHSTQAGCKRDVLTADADQQCARCRRNTEHSVGTFQTASLHRLAADPPEKLMAEWRAEPESIRAS